MTAKKIVILSMLSGVLSAAIFVSAVAFGVQIQSGREARRAEIEKIKAERDYLLRLAIGNDLIDSRLLDAQGREIQVDRQGRIIGPAENQKDEQAASRPVEMESK